MRIRTVLIALVAAGIVARRLLKLGEAAKQSTREAQTSDIVATSMPTARARLSAVDAVSDFESPGAPRTLEPPQWPTAKTVLVTSTKFTSPPDSNALPTAKRTSWLTVLFTVVFIFNLTVLPVLLVRGTVDVTNLAYRFGAGLFLGCYSGLGVAYFLRLKAAFFSKKMLQTIDTNKWLRPITFILMACIMVVGLLVWYVGWAGTNAGVPFGVGYFLSGLLSVYGPGRISADGETPEKAS